MALATLSVDLVARLAKFEADMGKAARSTEQAAQRMSASLGAVSSAIGGLAAGVSIAGIVSIGLAAVRSVDAFNDLKDATGASIENISALEDVAARTGTSFETVGTSLVKFNAALKDAKPGSDAEAAFKALGLSVKELQALDPAEALLKTSIALAGFADDGNKARLTQELFGKSLREVAPFLKDLAEKGKLVATVTTAQAEEAERFNKELFNMQKNSQDTARALTGDLVIGINKAAEALRTSGLIEGLRVLLTGDDEYKNNKRLVELTDQLLTAENALSGFRAQGFADGSRVVQNAKAQVAAIKEQIGVTQSYRKVLADAEKPLAATKPTIGPLPGKKEKPQAEQIDEASRALASYVKGLENTLATTEKLTEEQKALDFLKGLGTTGEIAQVRELVLGQAQKVDALKAEEAAYKTVSDARKSAEQYIQGLAKETQAITVDNQKLSEQVAEIGLTVEALNALRLARLDAAIATQEQDRAQLNMQNSSEAEIEAMDRKIALLKEQRALTAQGQVAQAGADSKEKADRASKDFADTLHNDLKGAFSTAFRDSSGEPLQAFGEAIANIVYTRAATALAESLIQSAGGTGATSFLGKLFSFDGGGFTGSGARAGGLDGKGGFLAVMHPKETVLDHTRNQAISSGGNTVSVQIIEAPGKGGQTSRSSDGGTDVLTVFVEQVKASIASDISRGSGAVPGAMSQTYGLNRVAGAY